jgi:hypothetical protein
MHEKRYDKRAIMTSWSCIIDGVNNCLIKISTEPQ